MGENIKHINVCPSCGYELSLLEKLSVNSIHGSPCPNCIRNVLIEDAHSRLLQFMLIIACTVLVIIFTPKLINKDFDIVFWIAIITWVVGAAILIKLKLSSSLHLAKMTTHQSK